MSQYRKKPVVIEAVQFNGNFTGQPRWLGAAFEDGTVQQGPDNEKGATLTIKTLEGDHTASLGDWIIQGVKGELYPCKPGIFEATYEAV